MPIAPGTREDELFRIAAAKPLKQFEGRWRYADSASLGSFTEEVNGHTFGHTPPKKH